MLTEYLDGPVDYCVGAAEYLSTHRYSSSHSLVGAVTSCYSQPDVVAVSVIEGLDHEHLAAILTDHVVCAIKLKLVRLKHVSA